MADGNMPKSHARVRRLLERRRDILVHPSNALTDDAANAAVPHHYYRGESSSSGTTRDRSMPSNGWPTSSGWRSAGAKTMAARS